MYLIFGFELKSMFYFFNFVMQPKWASLKINLTKYGSKPYMKISKIESKDHYIFLATYWNSSYKFGDLEKNYF